MNQSIKILAALTPIFKMNCARVYDDIFLLSILKRGKKQTNKRTTTTFYAQAHGLMMILFILKKINLKKQKKKIQLFFFGFSNYSRKKISNEKRN